jgi:hypothetical protein
MIFMIESQIRYILSSLTTMRDERIWSVDVRSSVQRAYNDAIHKRLAKTVWAEGGCVSWYRTRTGKNTTLWPGFMWQFERQMRSFDLSSYEIDSGPRVPLPLGRRGTAELVPTLLGE